MAKMQSNPKTKRPTYLRAWRKHLGLTLERAATRIGLSTGGLSQLERGIIAYTQPTLEAVAAAYGCEPWELIGRDPSKAGNVVDIIPRLRGQAREEAERYLRYLESQQTG